MRPTRSIPAIAVVLSLSLAACAGSSETAPSVDEASASDSAQLATCGTVSITVDRRSRYQAPIAGFLEDARTSGCAYGSIQIASAETASATERTEGYAGAAEVARDFIDAFDLAWRLQPEARDRSLSANSVRVTLLAPNEFAATQTVPRYR